MSKILCLVKKHLLDIIVIAAILLVSVAILLVSYFTRTEGAYAMVKINGETVAEYPLFIDGVYTLNGGTNVLTVKDGAAYITYSNCPGHDCEKKGKVKYVGQNISCLPNSLSVTVVGNSDGAVDFVS